MGGTGGSGKTRLHPERPIVSVGAIVIDADRVLLIKRAHEPSKGAWSVPGGVVELGETLEEALGREVREETGLDVDIGPVVEVVDRVERGPDGRVRYHFVIVDYVCRPRTRTIAGASDAEEARWVPRSELDRHALTATLCSAIAKAFRISASAEGNVSPPPVRSSCRRRAASPSASRRNTRGRRGAR